MNIFCKNLEIETPNGFVFFDGIRKIPCVVKTITFILEDGKSITVSETHRFDTSKFAKKYKVGDILSTKDGVKKIIDIYHNEKLEEVYDILEVGSKNHLYYANGIVNHNCSFVGSSKTLIAGEHLKRLTSNIADPIRLTKDVLYYEEPQPNHFYVVAADVAKGVGGDNSVIQVVDITKRKQYKLVASYANNFIRPEQLTHKILEVANEFNKAFVIVENNTYGYAICQSLWNEHFYENLFREPKKFEHGINANTRSKSLSTSSLKKLVEEMHLEITDKKTIEELHGFIELRENVYGCEDGENRYDDRVMALVWACYFTDTRFWTDQEEFLVNNNKKPNINKKEEIYEPVDIDAIDKKLRLEDASNNWL